MKTLLSLAAAASLAASFSGPASAQAPAAPGPQIVRYADLNLGSEAGLRELDRRLGAAIRTACGAASDVDLHGRNLVRRCRVDTRKAVAAQREAALASFRAASPDQLAGR